MREHLLGYLMGALDASQQKEIEQALEHDPQLRQELDLLDQALEPLRADRGLYEPPLGLADRTIDAVAAVAGWPDPCDPVDSDDAFDTANDRAEADHAARSGGASSSSPSKSAAGRRKPALAPVRETAGRSWSNRWAALDVAVSAAVVAAAAMLFFPAIASSRFQSRVTACQNNLRTIAQGLEKYSENHNGSYVPIPTEGKLAVSGVYAPVLHHEGYVPKPPFFCPGDPRREQAADSSSGATTLASNAPVSEQRIPTVSEMEQAVGSELRRLQRLAGGSYGYNLGYLLDGEYRSPRNLRRSTFAILADAPVPQRQGRHSAHHEGRGQNVLFEDGHIEFLPGGRAGAFDEIFYSDRELVEAGRHPDDSVIGASHSRPLIGSFR